MAKKQLGAAPSTPKDAATKEYVDTAVAGVSGGSGLTAQQVFARVMMGV